MSAPRWMTLTLVFASIAAVGCGGSKSSSKSGSTVASSTSATTGNASSSSSAAPSSGAPTATLGSGSLAVGGSAALAAAPQVAAINPQSGPVDGGTPVTITGAGFMASGVGETLVVFGTQAVRVTPVSDSEIQVSAPRGTTPQAEDVRVINDLGVGKLGAAFTYTPRPPALEFFPPVGYHSIGTGGTKITIDLKGYQPLTPSATVSFGTIAATAVAFVDSDTLIAEVPQGSNPGLVDITVDQGGVAISAPDFKVQDTPAYGDLIVNEFCAHPGGLDFNRDAYGDSKADEFVEIVNTTNEWIDLTYLTIWDGADRERHRFLNPTVLPPGGAIVVFGSGTPDGFSPRHESGQAQQAVADELALNNSDDAIEIRTMPELNPVGVTIFRVEYTGPPSGSSFVNKNDGQKITANPASSADYEDHKSAAGTSAKTLEASPGFRKDGTKF